jgi:hypothetical protein
VNLVARCVARHAVGDAAGAPRDAARFLATVRASERGLAESVGFVVRSLHAILVAAEEILARTNGIAPDPHGEPKARVLARLAEVLRAEDADAAGAGLSGLSGLVGADRDELAQRARIVAMLLERLERLREIGPARDRAIDDELEPWRTRVGAALRSRARGLAERTSIRRMFEEIEISRFAPKMPRQFSASEKRLAAMLGDE